MTVTSLVRESGSTFRFSRLYFSHPMHCKRQQQQQKNFLLHYCNGNGHKLQTLPILTAYVKNKTQGYALMGKHNQQLSGVMNTLPKYNSNLPIITIFEVYLHFIVMFNVVEHPHNK